MGDTSQSSVHSANEGPKPKDSRVARMILNDDVANPDESTECRLARLETENEEKIRRLQEIICTQRVFNRWVFLGRDPADPQSCEEGQECFHSKYC